MANKDIPPLTDADAIKSEWQNRLFTLVNEIKGWAEGAGWRTRRINKTLNERKLGTYRVPALLLEKDAVEVVLNPVARFVPGTEGAVDLYAAPAYDDIASLYYEGEGWVLHYAERPDHGAMKSMIEIKPHPYSEKEIVGVLEGMVANG